MNDCNVCIHCGEKNISYNYGTPSLAFCNDCHDNYLDAGVRCQSGKVPMKFNIIKLAKEGYDAYGEMAKWKNFQGADMPQWDALPDKIKRSWCSATHAIVKKYVDDFKSYVMPN